MKKFVSAHISTFVFTHAALFKRSSVCPLSRARSRRREEEEREEEREEEEEEEHRRRMGDEVEERGAGRRRTNELGAATRLMRFGQSVVGKTFLFAQHLYEHGCTDEEEEG